MEEVVFALELTSRSEICKAIILPSDMPTDLTAVSCPLTLGPIRCLQILEARARSTPIGQTEPRAHRRLRIH